MHALKDYKDEASQEILKKEVDEKVEMIIDEFKVRCDDLVKPQ